MTRENNQSDDFTDSGDPYVEYLWPRPSYPLLRKLDPRRARKRRQTRRSVRYEYYGPPITGGAATDFRSITLWRRDQQGWPIGKLNYLVCHQCRIGFIGNLDVQKDLWGNGIATGALTHLRRELPGYSWQTSRHYRTAKSFWLLVAERSGAAYADTTPDHTCEHLARFWRGGATRYTEPEAPASDT